MNGLRHLCAPYLVGLLASATSWAGNPPGVSFEDRTEAAGIHFRHERAVFSPRLKSIMPWLTAGGAAVAVGDYDNDGLDDIYFTTSALGKPNHLYHNEGHFRFREVGEEVGLARVNDSVETGTSSFALWLDYDNDGWQDLFLLRFGVSSLFHNERGTFTEVTQSAGVGRRTNALAAAAFDYDRDGDVDLFIGGYFPEKNFFNPPDTRVLFESWETARNGGRNYLFRNEGQGKFVDVTEQAGFQDSGWTMAVGHGDINNDGWQDVYLANDFGTDILLKNDRGRFVNISATAIGVDTKKGMNAELGDYNNDGLLDVYVTNMTEPYLSECNMLWKNNGDETFSDVSMETHSCDTKWGWGAKFLDADNDGRLDLYAANGFISAGARDYMEVLLEFVLNDEGDITDASRWPDMAGASMGGYEKNELLIQTAAGFVPQGRQAGVDSIRDGRGVAIADFDNDGRVDIVVANVDAAPNVYRNTSSFPNRWLQFRLTGIGKSNRSAVGARLYVRTAGGQQMREIASANGFDSQSSLQAHVGLGTAERIESVRVRWPDGSEQEAKGLQPSRVYSWIQGQEPAAVLRQGAGTSAIPTPAATFSSIDPHPPQSDARTGQPEFKEVGRQAGVDVRHHPPEFDSRLKHIMPMVAAGAAGGAIGDYNGDGLLDIFVNDSRAGERNHLFRNNGDMTFTDVGVSAGVAQLNSSDEVSSGGLFFDYDGDGWEDLLVLRFGRQVLMRNRHDGTFEDVSGRAGFKRAVNALAAVAFDYDRDGDLDLYLGSYFQDVNMFRLERDDVMHDSWETARNGGSNLFYRNNGDGTFKEMTDEVGLLDTGWTMALAHADLDGDGWQDVYIANDFGPDKVFRNDHGRKFEDVSARAIGVDTKKGMNAETADYDNDGDLDLFVTNVTEEFLHECNMLWQNDGHGAFTDVSQELGTCDTGWGWAGKFFDADNDMDLDLYVANGFFDGGGQGDYLDDLLPALWDNGENPADASLWPRINGKGIANRERNVFFRAAGGRFAATGDSGLDVAENSRAVLLGDFDNDGQLDVFVTNNDDEAQLFHNQGQPRNHWLGIELSGKPPNTKAIGARLYAHSGPVVQMREVNAGNGFGGGSTVRQHFGLGSNKTLDRLIIRWPDGTQQSLQNIAADRAVRIRQGSAAVDVIGRRP